MQAVEPLGVGQAEVEQHALRVAEQALRLRERAGARQHERRPRFLEESLDEHGVAIVVLDQEDAHCLCSHRVAL